MRGLRILLLITLVIRAGTSQDLEKGVLIDSLSCKDSREDFYALYVPETTDLAKSSTIMFFFEPAARASLPLLKYQSLAEKYGYILASSYASQNGPLEAGERAIQCVLNDLAVRWDLSPGYIITSGFSGGGRFAMHNAITRQDIRAVITCAGPKPSNFGPQTRMPQDLLYVGLVGDRDMNYLEHLQFRDTLIDRHIRNAVYIDTIGHQWPESAHFNKALEWIEFHRMDDADFKTRYLDSLKTDIESRLTLDPITYHYMLEDWYRLLDSDHGGFDYTQNDPEDDPALKKILKKHQKIMQDEGDAQEVFIAAINNYRDYSMDPGRNSEDAEYNQAWWSKKIRSLRKKYNDKDVLKAKSARRQIDFLRGMFYNYIHYAQTYNRFDFVAKLNALRIEMYPGSAWFHWLQAVIEARLRHKSVSLRYLEKAMEIDACAVDQFRQMPNFISLNDTYPWLF